MTGHILQWVSVEQALYLHQTTILAHGGIAGVNMPLLESAMARPQHLHSHDTVDIFQLAAAYVVGINQNHPFVDGNKRTGYIVAGLFLQVNRYKLAILDQQAQISFFEDVAAGLISENELAAYYRENTVN